MATSNMIEPIDIIIPTYNNPNQLESLFESIFKNYAAWPVRIIIVNNGDDDIVFGTNQRDAVKIIKPNKNLGWVGGINEGLKNSKSEIVIFANDDIYIPRSSIFWVKSFHDYFMKYPKLGAIGPKSNVVMGNQNIFEGVWSRSFFTPYLIGFCMGVRRKALDEVGWLDENLPGGDDIDLSIRLTKADWKLIVLNDLFIYHHGFQTGQRIYGGPERPGGWNSRQMSDETNMALVRKHGLKTWFKTLYYDESEDKTEAPSYWDTKKQEEEIMVLKYVKGKKILELGCGGNKTISDSIGVDLFKKGEFIPLIQQYSQADVVADVNRPMPFKKKSFDTIIARHILEHCLDTIGTLKNWLSYLKDDGRLILALPDEAIDRTIVLNQEHCHVFTEDSIKSIAKVLNLKIINYTDERNAASFVVALRKK